MLDKVLAVGESQVAHRALVPSVFGRYPSLQHLETLNNMHMHMHMHMQGSYESTLSHILYHIFHI